ncbi:MAG: transglutaminase domain-containing protein [Lachnospiraceae bacterium]|nr:transglutaminase domain-containing protein [Lachnospiraceae bacterium]
MKKRIALITTFILSLLVSMQVFAAAFTTTPIVPVRNYQSEITATANSMEEMQNVMQQAFAAHADTVYVTSNAGNIFDATSAYLESQIGGQIGNYNIHSCNGYQLSRNGKNYVITLYWLATIPEEQVVDTYVQQTAESITSGTTYDKIRKVHDHIGNLTEYSNETAAGQADYKSAYDAIVSQQTVCTGYALLFQKYMDTLGIPCYTAAGTRNGGPHMWNVVNVEGQWYHIDCTWDDQSSYIATRWFLCGADTAGYSTWGDITLAPTTLK